MNLSKEQREAIEWVLQVIHPDALHEDAIRSLLATPSADTSKAALVDRIISAALDSIRPDVSPEWGKAALRNHLNVILAAPTPEDAPSTAKGVMQALRNLRDALRMRHHGRMPEEVQTAYDAANELLAAAKPASVDAQPASGVDDARDAARYREIRDDSTRDLSPPCMMVYAGVYEHAVGTFPKTRGIAGSELDTLVDAAIAQRAKEK